jgi:hypothetical protein
MNQSVRLRSHVSTITLILANILTIVFAVVQKWDIADVLWIYWAQSLIIGIFHFLYILGLKQFSTKDFPIRSRLLHSPQGIKRTAAWFFLFHYGIPHLIFLVFLIYLWQLTPSMSALSLALCILAFLGAHGFSYWENRRKTADIKPNLWLLMFQPYARVIPMWLTLTVGINFARDYSLTLIIFLVLKTIADVVMHVIEINNVRADDEEVKVYVTLPISNDDETEDGLQPFSEEYEKNDDEKKPSETQHADITAKEKASWSFALPIIIFLVLVIIFLLLYFICF